MIINQMIEVNGIRISEKKKIAEIAHRISHPNVDSICDLIETSASIG